MVVTSQELQRPVEGPTGLAAFVRLVPAILATLLLGAHFLRFSALELSSACLILPFALLIRRQWVVRVYQVILAFAAVLWVRTAVDLAASRRSEGQPAGRLLVILLVVAAFTLLAAALFETPGLRRRYHLRTGDLFRSAPAGRAGNGRSGPPDASA